jgi:hypothetical protein
MQRLEAVSDRNLELYATDEQEIAPLRERVEEAGTSGKQKQVGNDDGQGTKQMTRTWRTW